MQLLLDTKGLAVKKRNNQFWISDGETTRMISPLKISSIAISADCLISTAAIRLAIEHEIPVFILDQYGSVSGMLWSPAFAGLPELRRQQAFFDSHSDAVKWLTGLFLVKTSRQQDNLAWLDAIRHTTEAMPVAKAGIEEAEAAFKACKELSLEAAKTKLMTIEAQMAKAYWAALSDCLPEEWKFEKRSRRPALDAFNAVLNYGYGMMYRVIELATFTAGLDPYMGIMHAEEYKRPTLVFDLIEPFRPWVDRLVLEHIINGNIQQGFFLKKPDDVQLARPGKAFWIPVFELWLKERLSDENDNAITRRSHINRYVSDFADYLRTWKP